MLVENLLPLLFCQILLKHWNERVGFTHVNLELWLQLLLSLEHVNPRDVADEVRDGDC